MAVVSATAFATDGPGYSGAPVLITAFFSVLGIVVAALSIAAKEPKRRFAYLAIGISSLPWLIGFGATAFQDLV